MALELFPLEVWEMVLDELEESEDIQNVFRAVPTFCLDFHSKKTFWLFDQVLPHIFKYCGNNPKDLLSLRQVSKRWCTVFDNFLEDHPSRRPYNPTGIHRRSVKYGEFVYTDLKEFPCVQLYNPHDISKWLEIFNGHSRNPFVGRCVKLGNPRPSVRENGHGRMSVFLPAVLDFLQIHGQHIHNVKFNFDTIFPPVNHYPPGEEAFKMIVKCLEYVPNLRSLGIAFWFYGPDMGSTYKMTFPPLPHLESFAVLPGMQYRSKSLDLFIRSYCGSSIKKLELYSDNWKHNYNVYFQNLTELVVHLYSSSFLSEFKSILDGMGGPSLKRIKLLTTTLTGGKVSHLLSLISSSKAEIEELEIILRQGNDQEGECILENEKTDTRNKALSVSSIKYLRIGISQNLGFGFLRLLPSLQNLTLNRKLQANEEGQLVENIKVGMESGKKVTLEMMIRSYIHMEIIPEKVNIWKELPALKVLTVVEVGGKKKQFARELGNKFLKTY